MPIRLWRQVVHQDIFLKRNRSTTTKQVADISNKVEKIVPSYVQTYASSLEGYEFSPESIQNMNTILDHVEAVLKRFPDGYFDQLDYGYYGGFEISIVEFAASNEMTVQYADDKYLMSFSMDCKAASDLLVEQDCRLMEAIFASTDKKLINYFENYEDPMFSESIWKELNPEDFYYHGYQDADYEKFNDYVVCYDGMRCAPKDRATLMESLMEPYAIPGPCLEKAEFYSRCIRQAFETGRGTIIMRAKTKIEDMPNGKSRIVVYEIPYMVNKASMVERIASLTVPFRYAGLIFFFEYSKKVSFDFSTNSFVK